MQWEQFDTTLCHRLRIWPTCFAIIQDRYLDSMYVQYIHTYIQYAQPFMNDLAEMKELYQHVSSVRNAPKKNWRWRVAPPHMHSDLPTYIDLLLGRWFTKKISNCANRTAVPTRKVPMYFAHAVTRINAEQMEWRARERWKFPVAFEKLLKKKKKKEHDHARSSVDARRMVWWNVWKQAFFAIVASRSDSEAVVLRIM